MHFCYYYFVRSAELAKNKKKQRAQISNLKCGKLLLHKITRVRFSRYTKTCGHLLIHICTLFIHVINKLLNYSLYRGFYRVKQQQYFISRIARLAIVVGTYNLCIVRYSVCRTKANVDIGMPCHQ